MTLGRPRDLAVVISLIAIFVLGVITVVFSTISEVELPLLYMVLLVLLCFAIIFPATYYLIKYFLQHKVRMIYRTLHELKSARSEVQHIDMDTDVLDEINRETQEWAREKKEEIKELEERELYRREFIGNLSHELKTPLFNIEGYILTLLEGGLEDENVNRDFLERAASGVERLTRIVEDMDMMSKLESGVLDMKVEKFDLMGVIAEVLKAMEQKAQNAQLDLVSKNALDRPVMILGDKDRIAQVFINLLNNSIRYGNEGGQVSIDILDIEGQLWVEVKDDGIGISREHLPRLFERFYRVGTSRSRNKGGSGLGLAIVKHIIDAHGQTITVASSEGKGTTFTFTLQKAK